MSEQREALIEKARQSQPLPELLRKAKKAERRGFYTQEQLDWAMAEGASIHARLKAVMKRAVK